MSLWNCSLSWASRSVSPEAAPLRARPLRFESFAFNRAGIRSVCFMPSTRSDRQYCCSAETRRVTIDSTSE